MAYIKFVNKLSDYGYPYHSRNYKAAHEAADKLEKKKYPQGYKKLERLEHSLNKHELMGKNTRAGKIEVEKKFKKYKDEISFHEREEHKALNRLNKKK